MQMYQLDLLDYQVHEAAQGREFYTAVCYGNWDWQVVYGKPPMNYYIGNEPTQVCSICGRDMDVIQLIGGEWTLA